MAQGVVCDFEMNISDLSIEMIASYAAACRQVHEITELARADRFDLLVVPSRGAHPFLSGAGSYAHALRNLGGYNAKPVIPLDQLYLPFTADISGDQEISSLSIRRYWARALSAILRDDFNDPAYQFYAFMRKIGGPLVTRGGINQRRGKSGKFIFIDTVVSGRAIFEIMESFESLGMRKCIFILLVDEQGGKLDKVYRRKIEEFTALGRAFPIFVDKIFTEDEGPSMSGIWTVTLPELMAAARRIVPEFVETGDVAATFYYNEVSLRLDGSNADITKSNGMLNGLLTSAALDDWDNVKMFGAHFIESVIDGNLQDQANTRAIAAPVIERSIPFRSLDVSGSHVLRAFVGEENAERVVRRFLTRDKASLFGDNIPWPNDYD
ncbi:hypothetical protein B5E41_21080 [Rhizobium esperanzae]|uniref:Uncharacterized protein n=1 Tax=Rhizobium esperanzae TaxID=1967781 RepID=A0A246DRL6_9HYPH|nr:hypothetical protein [Rhizobium esperanzae]OWO92924.1 hypothetical protein B5E41_21080 [Rhizobium esperanzae]